jgi:hypothetical protein
VTRKAVATIFAAALLASGCGGDKEGGRIPAREADRMVSLLEKADAQAAAGTCGGAKAKVVEAEEVAQSLSTSVDKDTRRRLNDGLVRLRELIQAQCQPPEDTTPDTTPTDTTPTETTPTQTTPTETTPTEPTPTDTTPTDTTPTGTTPTGTGTTTTGTGGTPPGTGNTNGQANADGGATG